MKVINMSYRNRSLITSQGLFKFDENGVSDVTPDEFAEELLKMKGFSSVDGESNVEIPSKSVDKVVNPEPTSESEEVSEEEPADNAEMDEEEIRKMNVPQLKKYAKDNGIDLGDASKKDEIIKIILG